LFFSFARNVLVTYVLPAMPPLALLTAHLLRRLRWTARPVAFVTTALLVAAVAITLVVAECLWPDSDLVPSQERLVALWRERASDSPLVYLFDKPFSVDFYTSGRARLAHPNDALELLQKNNAVAFAVAAAHKEKLPSPLADTLTLVGRRNGTVLRVAKSSH
jgi:4-amino-4-deoxy-L-arabinose transferase-like glycosyltransferase